VVVLDVGGFVVNIVEAVVVVTLGRSGGTLGANGTTEVVPTCVTAVAAGMFTNANCVLSSLDCLAFVVIWVACSTGPVTSIITSKTIEPWSNLRLIVDANVTVTLHIPHIAGFALMSTQIPHPAAVAYAWIKNPFFELKSS
jgi:hypothetical protein